MRVVRCLPIILLAVVTGACAEQARPQTATPERIEVPNAPAPSVGPQSSASTSPPTEQDEARRLLVEGRQLMRAKAYLEAIAKLEASMKKVPQTQILYDIGSCYEAMGEKHKAADTYEIYVASGELSHIDRMSMELRIKQLRHPE